ncbi:MAG: DUF3014 domain-containing protein [Methylococcaceae bacterium]
MGRYDQSKSKKSRRYLHGEDKDSSGISVFMVIVLMIFAAAGGFYLAKVSDTVEFAPELQKLLSFSDDTEKESLSENELPESEDAIADKAETDIDHLEPMPEQDEQTILPLLDNSDEWLRKTLTQLSPGLAQWLNKDQLIRTYMTIANDFSQGERIGKHMRFLKPAQAFAVNQDENGLFIAPQSYQRYDELAKVIDALDVEATLAIYKNIRPLLMQVFAEFGYPEDYRPEDMFTRAAAEILAAPVIENPAALVKTETAYKFADQELEAAKPLHKQMIRMGPENTRLIKNKIRLLSDGLAAAKTD